MTLQNASFTYDALNRLATVTDKDAGGVTRITVANDYDANGNVMKVASVYPDLTHGSGTLTPVHYYRYDSMNRMVVAGGSVVGGNIVRGASGQDIAYDLAGRRVSVTRDTGLTGQAWTWIWYEGHGPGSPYWPEIATSGINGDMGYADAATNCRPLGVRTSARDDFAIPVCFLPVCRANQISRRATQTLSDGLVAPLA